MRRSGFSLGKILGIRVRVDWSWLLIFALITWNLATAFPQLHPEWTPGLGWALALIGALLFFGSVLAHELAHSLVAKSQGTEVDSITLFLFGGVSNIQEEPKSPQNEFLMAVVGPLTSLVLGGVLITVVRLVSGRLVALDAPASAILARFGPWSTLGLWLGTVNVILGVFNLVPGFPLDGGRVVRSILWAVTDDLRRATRWASWLGQGIAWTMIFAGIASAFGARIPLVGQGLISGLWLAFIGWFLSNAATQSYQHIVVEDILDDVSVSRLMRRDPPTVEPNISLSSFVNDYVLGTDDYGFPVMETGRLVGIITLDDVRSVGRDAWDTTLVRQTMTPASEVLTVDPEACVSEALDKLTARDIRQVPVMDNGQLVGLLRRQDVVRYLRLHSELS